MRLIVNGTSRDARPGSLADLLGQLGQNEANVATAVNENFVAKSQRALTVLNEGDRVEIVAPRQGG